MIYIGDIYQANPVNKSTSEKSRQKQHFIDTYNIDLLLILECMPIDTETLH